MSSGKPSMAVKEAGIKAYYKADIAAPPRRMGASLGLKVDNRESLIRCIRAGLSVHAFEHLSRMMELTPDELARHVAISSRTLARRKQEGRLHADESDRLARLALLFDEAVILFEGDQGRAARWFRSPLKALGSATPLEYADTEPGAQEVRDLIGRLEHGVFS